VSVCAIKYYFTSLFLIFIFCLYSNQGRAVVSGEISSPSVEDSLIQLISKERNDSVKARHYCNLAVYYHWNQAGKMVKYAEKAYLLAVKTGNEKIQFDALIISADARFVTGDYGKGLQESKKAMDLAKKYKWEERLVKSMLSMALLHSRLGNFQMAVDTYLEILDTEGRNIDSAALASTCNNLSNNYMFLSKYDESLKYRNLAINIRKNLEDSSGLGDSYNDMGEMFLRRNQPDSAIVYLLKCFQIKRSIGDVEMTALSALNLGLAYIRTGNLAEAEKKLDTAYTLSVRIEAKAYMLEILKFKTEIYETQKKYPELVAILKEMLVLKDSLFTEENAIQLNRAYAEFDVEKRDMQIEVMQNEHRQREVLAEKERREARMMLIFFIAGFILLAGILIIGIQRYRITRKQKAIIAQQKKAVDKAYLSLEERNREVLDSIQYAQRLQKAILPPAMAFQEVFSDSYFVLYQPKDIVAGDFYWLEKTEECVLFAAADCTGHGVPGAMVSVVCNNALNRSVREYGLRDPGKILDKTREIVISEFAKSTDEVKDGMDISLVAWTHGETDGQLSIQWAGANNPLWIVRNGEILETKADKQPIGKYTDASPFTSHNIDINKGDMLYLFTDGFQDQFGGEKGKKYKAANLKQFLISIVNEPLAYQRELLIREFEQWRKNTEQIDDLCIIGVKV
jgi:serine phosphatase RsbU (regulator of sigma subunit)